MHVLIVKPSTYYWIWWLERWALGFGLGKALTPHLLKHRRKLDLSQEKLTGRKKRKPNNLWKTVDMSRGLHWFHVEGAKWAKLPARDRARVRTTFRKYLISSPIVLHIMLHTHTAIHIRDDIYVWVVSVCMLAIGIYVCVHRGKKA